MRRIITMCTLLAVGGWVPTPSAAQQSLRQPEIYQTGVYEEIFGPTEDKTSVDENYEVANSANDDSAENSPPHYLDVNSSIATLDEQLPENESAGHKSAEATDPAAPAGSNGDDSGYGCNCDCSRNYGQGGLCSFIRPSDHCYDDFISPMTNPVFFEDPRNLTEARVIFLNHKVPLTAGGGDIQVYVTQLRAALTDRLSVIVTKDGYIVSENPVVGDGWADISAGVKYLLYSDPANQTLMSAGVVYEIPLGTHDARQGQGDGTFDLFLSGGTQICCHGHWIGGGGIVLPTNDEENNTWCYISNHFDYEFHPGIYALTEFSWYHWMESGGDGVPGISGGDLFNFGSEGVAGNDIVTGAFGMKYKPSGKTEIGVAWEVPLTERRDVLENRLTFDWIFRY